MKFLIGSHSIGSHAIFKSKSSPPDTIKTPQSKLHLHYNNANKPNPSSNPNTLAKETTHPQEHLVKVITRIQDYPDRKEKPTLVLNVNSNNHSIRVRADFGYWDFSLDEVSLSEDQGLDLFYKTFVEIIQIKLLQWFIVIDNCFILQWYLNFMFVIVIDCKIIDIKLLQ